tara:strand:+ start:2464 stop:2823 length:360 start_codon:yes stop_codon:yes gene_type:complete
MKKSQLRQIIKEEIKRSLREAVTPEIKGKLNKSLMAYHNEGGTKEQVISMVNTVFGKKENSVNEYASEAQQDYYGEVIKNTKWDSYEEAWGYLESQGLEDRMISNILTNAGMDDYETNS